MDQNEALPTCSSGVNVSANGCSRGGPAINWCLSPQDSWDRLHHPGNPECGLSGILALNLISRCSSECHHSEYQVGADCCPMCPPGKRVKNDCTQIRSTSCAGCLEGTYMDRPNGLKYCLPCKNCRADPSLKVKTTCTTNSNTVCEPMEGFYCVNFADGGCAAAQKHTSCEPGQYISERGTAQRDTVCSDCSDGTYSNGTFTSCQRHRNCQSENLQLIKAGSVSADAECGAAGSDRTGLIVGPVVGLVLIAVAVAGGCLRKKRKDCCTDCKKKQKRNQNQNTQESNEASSGNQMLPHGQVIDDQV